LRSKNWKTELERLQISTTTTSLYHPQSDGLSERNIQNILNKLRILSREDNQNWHHYLQIATNAVNANRATATKECPKDIFNILYNNNVDCQQTKTQIQQNLLFNQKQVEEKENKKRNDVEFENDKLV
jgi:hypothetical protein